MAMTSNSQWTKGIAQPRANDQMKPQRVLHVLGTAEPAGIGIFKIVESLALGVDPAKYEIHACFLRSGELAQRLQRSAVKATCINWNGSRVMEAE